MSHTVRFRSTNLFTNAVFSACSPLTCDCRCSRHWLVWFFFVSSPDNKALLLIVLTYKKIWGLNNNVFLRKGTGNWCVLKCVCDFNEFFQRKRDCCPRKSVTGPWWWASVLPRRIRSKARETPQLQRAMQTWEHSRDAVFPHSLRYLLSYASWPLNSNCQGFDDK